MGWTAHELPDKRNPEGVKWWTRGGMEGDYIQLPDGLKIHIPAELIIMLVADYVRSQKVSALENTTDFAVLGLRE